jgi:hypothetical protein
MNATASNLDPALPQRETTSFVIDSREVQAGDVFFALSQPEYQNNGFNGEFEDATAYAASAFEKGAVACVLRSDRYRSIKANSNSIVTDSYLLTMRYSLSNGLAHGVYLDWNGPWLRSPAVQGKRRQRTDGTRSPVQPGERFFAISRITTMALAIR